jgi:hypothetical protein
VNVSVTFGDVCSVNAIHHFDGFANYFPGFWRPSRSCGIAPNDLGW